MRQNGPEPRPGRAGPARRTRARARAALAAIARLGAALCAAWILAGAFAAPAAAHALATASAPENSPLGLGRNPAPARALAERPQAPESPPESAFAYAQTAVDNAFFTRGPKTLEMAGDGTRGDNRAQNKQFEDAKKQAEREAGRKMTPDERRRFHDEVTGQDYGWDDLVEVAKDILKK
jgi:hypothetical protein